MSTTPTPIVNNPMSEHLGLPTMTPESYMQMLQQQQALQANTAGLTHMAPNTAGATPPVQRQFKDPGQQQTSAFGVGEKGAHQRESMQNLVKASQSFANQIGQQIQAKQNREYEQTITRFTGATQGVAQAQAQIVQASQALKQNPQDAQAQQQLQTAQAALKQNQAILNDLATDKKHAKTIMKAFGIDDKNANSPERAAAIEAIKKQMGVGDKAASIQAQIPSTQQLSPAAQAQQTARQAGVVGAPATGGQILTNIGKVVDGEMKRGAATDKLVPQLAKVGLVIATDEQGNPQKNEDGTTKIIPMTPEQRALIPGLKAQDDYKEAMTEYLKAKKEAESDPNSPQNAARAMNAQAHMLSARAAMLHAKKYEPGAGGPAAGGMDNLVDMFHRGELDPSQVPGFGKARTAFFDELHKKYPDDNPAQAQEDYKFASSVPVQMVIKGLDNLVGPDGKSGNLAEVVKASNEIKRTDFPAINDMEAWVRINKGDPKMAAYYAQCLEVSDQIAKILQGGGTGGGTSDAKLKQAQSILNSGFSKDQIKSIAESLGPLLSNRKNSMIGNNRYLKNQYGGGYGEASGGGASSDSEDPGGLFKP